MTEKKLQKLPIGVQSFEQLRTEHYLYVDKTKDVYRLATDGKAYFFSRPRRFGKSLLCSTFKALFEGKKHLFDDTWIATSDWEWQEHPVIYLDFNSLKYETPAELKEQIELMIADIAKEYGVTLDQKTAAGNSLSQLINALCQPGKPKPVVLIDEYDKPIVNSLHNLQELEAYRDILYSCYTPLKPLGEKMAFLFITGVSQFAKVSIFSALNHLKILSGSAKAATICGYTQAELEHCFAAYIEKATTKFGYTREQMLAEIKRWYNGYCFTIPEDAPERVYNPFSVLNFFDDLSFKNYWFISGTPTFVINYFKDHEFCLADFENVETNEATLSALIPESLNLTTLLFQTGYLTIKSYAGRQFSLSFPNQEVAESCSERLLEFIQPNTGTALLKFAQQLRTLFLTKNVTVEPLMAILKNVCAHIPYTVKPSNEKGYQLIFYLMLQLIGLNVHVEEPTAVGRIDAVIEVGNHAFVLELKLNGSADKAMEQIVSKRYTEKYLAAGFTVTSIGAVFDKKLRTMTDCQIL